MRQDVSSRSIQGPLLQEGVRKDKLVHSKRDYRCQKIAGGVKDSHMVIPKPTVRIEVCRSMGCNRTCSGGNIASVMKKFQ